MTKEKKIFNIIETHLLEDETPSIFLKEALKNGDFDEYPFNMLSDLTKAEQNPEHHPEGNVWNHTLLVIDQAAKRRNQSSSPKVFMWAALLHDIGKPAATALVNGRLTAYDHDKIGEKLSKKFLSAVDAPETFIYQVSNLVRFHMHLLFITKNMPFADIKGLKKHTDIHEIALLSLCDRMGRTGSHLKTEEKNVNIFLSKVLGK